MDIKTTETAPFIPRERVENCILLIRGQKVMLDRHLAELYGVPTKKLNQAAKRNWDRFPKDFMFQVTMGEWADLKSQIGISSSLWGGQRYLPYAFTEQGVAILSGVLNSKRAVQVNIVIMRAFVRLRRVLTSNRALAKKLEELARKVQAHDGQIQSLFDEIRQLVDPPEKPKQRIGFQP